MNEVERLIKRGRELEASFASLDVKIATHKKYDECNVLPSNLPYVTAAEAGKAFKLLCKKFGKKKVWSEYRKEWVTKKMRGQVWEKHPRKCWVCLSGDPNTLGKGWRRIIHDVSHMIHQFLRPTFQGHCFQHAELELEMVKYVLQQDWLKGSLKPKINVLSKDEKKQNKIKNLQSLIKRWEIKNKTTLTYLKKYKTKLKRLSN